MVEGAQCDLTAQRLGSQTLLINSGGKTFSQHELAPKQTFEALKPSVTWEDYKLSFIAYNK